MSALSALAVLDLPPRLPEVQCPAEPSCRRRRRRRQLKRGPVSWAENSQCRCSRPEPAGAGTFPVSLLPPRHETEEPVDRRSREVSRSWWS